MMYPFLIIKHLSRSPQTPVIERNTVHAQVLDGKSHDLIDTYLLSHEGLGTQNRDLRSDQPICCFTLIWIKNSRHPWEMSVNS